MSFVKFKHYPTKSFNNFMNDFLIVFPSLYRDNKSPYPGQSVPVNIKENGNGYRLDIIAPGFTKDDLRFISKKIC